MQRLLIGLHQHAQPDSRQAKFVTFLTWVIKLLEPNFDCHTNQAKSYEESNKLLCLKYVFKELTFFLQIKLLVELFQLSRNCVP